MWSLSTTLFNITNICWTDRSESSHYSESWADLDTEKTSPPSLLGSDWSVWGQVSQACALIGCWSDWPDTVILILIQSAIITLQTVTRTSNSTGGNSWYYLLDQTVCFKCSFKIDFITEERSLKSVDLVPELLDIPNLKNNQSIRPLLRQENSLTIWSVTCLSLVHKASTMGALNLRHFDDLV